jgi:hypothetical protein
MRTAIAVLALLIAAPAAAQAPAPSAPPPAEQQVERALNDPAMADRLAHAMDAVSKAFLNLRVGEVQAAVEGREATPAEKQMTVRDLERRSDPDFERNFRRQMAQVRPIMQQSMKAMAEALPAMRQGLEQAREAIERAAANMPDPTYPKR